jgi:glycosyltransferase involved in cell wall biosynthesis
MGQRGRKWVEAEFAWETVAREMLRLYGKLLLNTQSTT